MGQDNIALYLTIYGSALSTTTIIWNIVHDIENRLKIKVEAKFVDRPGIMFDRRRLYLC